MLSHGSCHAQSDNEDQGKYPKSHFAVIAMLSRNKEMHLVLLSLANIKAGVRMKATVHAFALAAYLPIPKFLDVSAQVQAALTAHIYHICLYIICKNLKAAEKDGALLLDPTGNLRQCHTILAYFRTSPHSPKLLRSSLVIFTTSHSAIVIIPLVSSVRPTHWLILQISVFLKVCEQLKLNGVHQPFWVDWGKADPAYFLAVYVLHAFHKFFFDHPLKWVINIIGGDKLDCCMAALQLQVGRQHWQNGISKLKQVTG